MNLDKNDNQLLISCIIGLLGAILVGIGEFVLQFSVKGGYESANYDYFVGISDSRLSYGHFFSVLAAPLYLIGYWHIGQMFVRGGSVKSGWFITLFGGYAFVIGTAWLGGRVYLAYTAKAIAIAEGESVQILTNLLHIFADHNEPLVNVLRLAMLIVSILWIVLVSRNKTLYPSWMAVFNPITLLAIIFATYFYISPALGAWLLPAAMNVVHIVIFSLSAWIVLRLRNEKTARP